MKKFFTILFSMALLSGSSFAQLTDSLAVNTINDSSEVAGLIDSVLFGPCVTISNLSFSGAPTQFGYFEDNSTTTGLSSGLVMSTGSAIEVIDPTQANIFTGSGGDSTLLQLLAEGMGASTNDVAVVEFDFVTSCDSIFASEFIFGSEEYPEYVNSIYNDVFGFFISGPGYDGQENIALVPGTSDYIAINNVNEGMNSEYYVDNTTNPSDIIALDAYTTPFSLMAEVEPYESYHFKIAIADVSDGALSSAVLIQTASFNAETEIPMNLLSMVVEGNTVSFNNPALNANEFYWDFGDGSTSTEETPSYTYAQGGTYNVSFIAANACDSDTLNFSVEIESANTSIDEATSFCIKNKGGNTFGLNGGAQSQAAVYDLQGRRLINKTLKGSESLSLQHLEKGIYIIELIANNQRLAQQVLIQ